MSALPSSSVAISPSSAQCSIPVFGKWDTFFIGRPAEGMVTHPTDLGCKLSPGPVTQSRCKVNTRNRKNCETPHEYSCIFHYCLKNTKICATEILWFRN